MTSLSRHRWRRRFSSASPILLAVGPAVLVPLIVGLFWGGSPLPKTLQASFVPVWALLLGVLGSVGLLWLRCASEYRKLTFDPTLALKYWDEFGSSEMYRTRERAAQALEEHAQDLDQDNFHDPDIDDVLDIFEDIGFYVRGDQLTPEVAHQDFYYWIRGYYSTARPYLEKKQRGSANQWTGVRYLFEVTHEVELEQRANAERFMTDEERIRFLEEERYDPAPARRTRSRLKPSSTGQA